MKRRVKREAFCTAYPDLCQKPDNLAEFCEMQPYFCSDNISNLEIPKLGYYASNLTNDVHDALMEIYIHNISQDGANLWSWEVPYEQENYSKITTNYIFDFEKNGFATCYSTNLHIYGGEEVETTIFDDTFISKHVLNTFEIFIREEEAVYPWTVPEIMLSIHSPFIPVYPFYEGEILELGHMYIINIRMEEEHLLEYPYYTDCTDYEHLWEKNNKTGPRSQEMCKRLCTWNYLKPCAYCDHGLIVVDKPIWVCEYIAMSSLGCHAKLEKGAEEGEYREE
ncbi:uncharacterized protein NPIL_320041 [Nephila pilipes]|uniref:Uncharacterized protein n=1 Tax=Nephila pilipes TaxID=299642 RepID=A0A8X6NZL0_NEPPI|nr:uncharacterized protein NPIL_320041 [Nephila pilipes]